MKLFSETQYPALILLMVLLQNQDHKADHICMKISVLPPIQLVLTVIELTILQ